jgi:hypothetical protein
MERPDLLIELLALGVFMCTTHCVVIVMFAYLKYFVCSSMKGRGFEVIKY